ncbi:unnamed protein product [Absidia cylindrospora]
MVATFTRKAAIEMKERLESDDLLGPMKSNLLTMGTFHSICARYLRQYATSIRLPNDFRIIEPQETNKILLSLIDNDLTAKLSPYLERSKATAAGFKDQISEAKNNGLDAEEFELIHYNNMNKSDLIIVFKAYDERLRMEHLVDFDDLLLFGRQLFRAFPHVVNGVSHILVDEFQDTNKVQYDIMKNIARHSKSITIVGDPDQSIYGFRNANVANFTTMREDFEGTEIVTLEENYRSTDCILDGAFHVIEQDDERIEKGLYTNNGKGTPISLLHCESEIPESLAVAEEILRMTHFSKGLIKYGDIAILVRVHYLTQNMETALRASDIPYEIIGGVRFFERMEVKDLVAYVHFIYNSNDTLSFERIINTPRRGVGEVTLDKICTLSRVRDKTVLDILKDLCSPHTKKRKTSGDGTPLWDFALPPRVKNNLKKFITLCTEVKAMMDNKESVRRILDYIIKFSDYQAYLKQDYKDHEVRWDNVGELMTIAGRYDKKAPAGADQEGGERGSQMYGDLASQAVDDGTKPLIGDIDAFVANTTLNPDATDDKLGERKNRVQIMTIHAAKGLEWPCVFILACEQGIIPHARAEKPNEEARLLYVAMTRAKCFLYMTYASSRSSWGSKNKGYLSCFLKDLPTTTYQRRTPAWNDDTRTSTAHILQLPAPPSPLLALEPPSSEDYDDDSDATTDEDEEDEHTTDHQKQKQPARPVNPDDHPGDEFPQLDMVLADG